MNLHFAGADGNIAYNNPLHELGAKNRLESFYSLATKSPSRGFNLLLDSGGFVARTKGINIRVQEFARYIKKNNVKFAFELDVMDAKTTEYNREYLMKETAAKIIPVYHYSDFVEKNYKLLYHFIENFDYISIGGVAGEGNGRSNEKMLYDFVFSHTQDKVKVHGLGITALGNLKNYPFYSVDSTSWLSAARFGNFKSADDKNKVEWIKSNRHYLYNTRNEIRYWLRIEKYITKLWKERGIIWDSLTAVQ